MHYNDHLWELQGIFCWFQWSEQCILTNNNCKSSWWFILCITCNGKCLKLDEFYLFWFQKRLWKKILMLNYLLAIKPLLVCINNYSLSNYLLNNIYFWGFEDQHFHSRIFIVSALSRHEDKFVSVNSVWWIMFGR